MKLQVMAALETCLLLQEFLAPARESLNALTTTKKVTQPNYKPQSAKWTRQIYTKILLKEAKLNCNIKQMPKKGNSKSAGFAWPKCADIACENR